MGYHITIHGVGIPGVSSCLIALLCSFTISAVTGVGLFGVQGNGEWEWQEKKSIGNRYKTGGGTGRICPLIVHHLSVMIRCHPHSP